MLGIPGLKTYEALRAELENSEGFNLDILEKHQEGMRLLLNSNPQER